MAALAEGLRSHPGDVDRHSGDQLSPSNDSSDSQQLVDMSLAAKLVGDDLPVHSRCRTEQAALDMDGSGSWKFYSSVASGIRARIALMRHKKGVKALLANDL